MSEDRRDDAKADEKLPIVIWPLVGFYTPIIRARPRDRFYDAGGKMEYKV